MGCICRSCAMDCCIFIMRRSCQGNDLFEKFLLCHMAQDVRRVNKRDFGGFDVLLKALFFLHI